MRHPRGRLRPVAAAALLLAVSSVPVRALTDEEIFRDFQFNLVNPGPRAMGLGGAFAGIADDATAVQTNPAGLSRFDTPEIFVEFRFLHHDATSFSSSLGSAAVDPDTGARNLPFLELRSVADPEPVSEPSFIGGASPIAIGAKGRRLTFAASRQVVLSDERKLGSGGDPTRARFAFETFPNTVNGGVVEAYTVNAPVAGFSDARIVHWNLGAGYDLHPDFSVGATITYAALDITAQTLTTIEDPLELFADPSHPRRPSQPAADEYRTAIDDSDLDLTYSVGVHWHPSSVFASGTARFSFAAVFRKGAKFEVREATSFNGVADPSFQNTIVVPDRYSLGWSYRASERFLLSGELERVEYSDLLLGFRSGVNFLTSERLADGAFATNPAGSAEFTVDDGTIPRIGVEYLVPTRKSLAVAVQGGYYRMPDARVRMSRFNSGDPAVDQVYLEAFRGGDAVDHLTLGSGFRFGRSRVQVAGDFSDEGTQIVAAYVFEWPRRIAK